MDVRVKAQELADAIVESPEYQKLQKAKETVEQHEAAKIMLRDFKNKQEELQKQQLEGRPVTEKQTEELKKLYEVLSINPYIRELFEAEFGFGGLMMEVQDIISKALGFPGDDEDEGDEDEPAIEVPNKKLWTPGS